MAYKLVVTTGSFNKYGTFGKPGGELITQSHETGNEMMEKGIELCKEVAESDSTTTRYISLNNGDFFNGIRLAVKRGLIKWDEIHFNHINAGGYDEHPTINDAGRMNEWPVGFFDANDLFLTEIL